MSSSTPAVLDASVGVKWLREEAGREAAHSLLERHHQGLVRIIVPAHFLHEVLSVAVRDGGPDTGAAVWEALRLAELTVVALDDAVAAEAFHQCSGLGCSFYDALAPAVAEILGARLYSADRRAHSAYPNVEIIG
jgi:predicted nucleic acid-binding protein